MAPLVIDGDTPGQKHRNYNNIVNNAKLTDVPDVSYEVSDFENFFRIDIACRNKNVDYVLKVFQSEDLRYVSRAIKRSTWLVTEQQYSHVINPRYLYEQLYHNMMPKAFSKLLLHIRLNLKDEVRVEEFFNYYKEYNFKVALKWLPFCSLEFIEIIIRRHAEDIPKSLLRRLCKRSISCLEVFLSNFDSSTSMRYEVLAMTTFTMNQSVDKYLDILDKCHEVEMPRLGPKSAKLLMKESRERVLNSLDTYKRSFSAIAKYIRRKDMKEFILMNLKKKTKLCSRFSPKIFGEIIDRLPEDNRFEFIKEVFIDTKNQDLGQVLVPHPQMERNICTSEDIYKWYKFAPFDTAFEELKNLINFESEASERMVMLEALLRCAKENLEDIGVLLKYYRKNHIREPMNLKTQFVKLVLETDTHRFNEETWKCLSDIVSKIDIGSVELGHAYIRSIILYNVVRDGNIPEGAEAKFLFDTFKSHHKKLTEDEKEKLFSYLYKYLTSKIDKYDLNNRKEICETVDLLNKILILLIDWNKELENFPNILHKIKEICEIKRKNQWDIDLSELYNNKKSWRKVLFFESIILSPTQQTCINFLKLRPELLQEFKSEVEAICLNHKIPTNLYFKKLRLCYPQTLVNDYKDLFINKLAVKGQHKASITGLFYLLPRHEVIKLLERDVSFNINIDSKRSNLQDSIRKHVARSLHLVRPLISLQKAMLYAKSDYLRYAIPSLDCLVDNSSSLNTREHLEAQKLDSPISLLRHKIRAVIAKQKPEELKNTLYEIWKSNDSNIRFLIFKRTFKNLCAARDKDSAQCFFELLSFFVDNSNEENHTLFMYNILIKADQVPMWVRPDFWMMSYTFFDTNSPNAGCDIFFENLKQGMVSVMEFLDDDFVTCIFLKSLDDKFSTGQYEYRHLVALFLLSTRTEQAHVTRFNKLLVPLLDRSLALLDDTQNSAIVRSNLLKLFGYLDEEFKNHVLVNKMFFPVPMFRYISERLSDNYSIITSRKFALDCVQSFDNAMKSNDQLRSEWESPDKIDLSLLYSLAAVELGRSAADYIKANLAVWSPPINNFYAFSFNKILRDYKFSMENIADAIKVILQMSESTEGYLFVTELMPLPYWRDQDKDVKLEIMNEIKKSPSKEVKMHLYRLQMIL